LRAINGSKRIRRFPSLQCRTGRHPLIRRGPGRKGNPKRDVHRAIRTPASLSAIQRPLIVIHRKPLHQNLKRARHWRTNAVSGRERDRIALIPSAIRAAKSPGARSRRISSSPKTSRFFTSMRIPIPAPLIRGPAPIPSAPAQVRREAAESCRARCRCVSGTPPPFCKIPMCAVTSANREHRRPRTIMAPQSGFAPEWASSFRVPGENGALRGSSSPLLIGAVTRRVDLAASSAIRAPSYKCNHERRRRPRTVGCAGRIAPADRFDIESTPEVPSSGESAADPGCHSHGAGTSRKASSRARASRISPPTTTDQRRGCDGSRAADGRLEKSTSRVRRPRRNRPC